MNLNLPIVSVVIENVKRNKSRTFNKIKGFSYPSVRDPNDYGPSSAVIPPVVAVDISIKMTMIATYQTDMDQIMSNWAAYANPYIMIGWKVPEGFGLPTDMPIYNKVEWDGNIDLDYPADITHSDRSVITAEANFVMEGWLFKDDDEPAVKNIYFIENNFSNTRILSAGNNIGYDDYATLSGADYHYSEGQISITQTEGAHISGSPINITNLFYSISGQPSFPLLNENFTIETPGKVILYGKRFDWTKNVYLSSNDSSYYGTLTGRDFTYYDSMSGALLPVSAYRIITDNVMELDLPTLTAAGEFNILVETEAGWDTSYSGMSGHFLTT